MIVKQILTLLLVFFACVCTWAQDGIAVKSCVENVTDLSASTNLRRDQRGEACALVKVQVVADKVRFNGVIVGEVEQKGNEYWVYMRQGAERLSVQVGDLPALDIQFEDYQIKSLAGKVTYVVRLEVSDSQLELLSDSMQYIVFQVFPDDATVILDGDTLKPEGGSVYKRVKIGRHNYKVTKKFYSTETGVVNVEKDETKVKRLGLYALKMKISLFSTDINLIPVNYDCFAGDNKDEDNELHSFLLCDTEVPQTLWRYVMSGWPGMKGSNPSVNKGGNQPVDNVSYEDCLEFIRRLNEYSGYEFRLPTEQEWEYAARSGQLKSDIPYSGGTNLDEISWNAANSKDKSHPVAKKKPNGLGLYDMTGNVEEWVISEDGPVTKGGNYTSAPEDCNLEKRGSSKASKVVGLRLAL